jgi:hypothetical protein
MYRFDRPMTSQRCTDDACETRGIAAIPTLCAERRASAGGRPSVSSMTVEVGAHGWARARCGVDAPRCGWRAAQQALRGPLEIRCRGPLATARWANEGIFESAASTQENSLRSADSLEPVGWGIPYRCFVGVGLTCAPSLPLCALARGLQARAPKRHRPSSASDGALNFCLIKHLQDRAGEKHYRCEAAARHSRSTFYDGR